MAAMKKNDYKLWIEKLVAVVMQIVISKKINISFTDFFQTDDQTLISH